MSKASGTGKNTKEPLLKELEELRQKLARLTAEFEAAKADALHNEARFFELLDSLPVFAYLQRPDHTIRYANKYCKNLYGEPGDRPCYEVIWGRKEPCDPCPTFRVFDTNKAEVWESSHSDGSAFMIYDIPFTDTDGTPLVLEISLDRTDAKRSADELKSCDEQYQMLVDTIPYGIQENDLSGTITFGNPALARLQGYDEGELIGKAIWDFLDKEEDREELRRYLKVLVKEQPAPTPYIGKNRTKDGRLIDVHVDWNYKRDKDGKLTGFISIVTDITEQKRAEEALRENVERFNQLANNIDGVFWLTDLNENEVHYVSPAYVRIWGRTTESLYKNPKSWGEAIHPDDQGSIRKKNADYRKNKCEDSFDEEYRIVRPDGSIRWIRDRAFPVRDASGSIYRVAGIAEDITVRKQAEEEKKRLQAQLIQAQKMEAIGTLAGGIAHDFNNIMTVVKNLTALAMDKMDKSDEACPYSHYLQPIREVSERGINLIQQLLIFSKNKPVELAYLNMNDVIDDFLKVIGSLIGEDITIQKKLEQGLWDIRADKGRIEQVLTNLVINSRDSLLMGGTITLRTENVTLTADQAASIQGAAPGNFICLTVQDDGKGMDSDVIEHIFEPFFTTKAPNGTGLGLSVVYGIVKEMGGWITVTSRPERGTKFMIYLPISTGHEKAAKGEPARKKVFHGDGRRILLVEDDKWVRKSIAMVLAEHGYAVFEAPSAEQAISAFYKEKGRFDLVISDVVMPGRNGLQLVSPLLDINPDVPILLCSGHLDDKAQLEQIVKRGLPYIQKPFEIEELLQAAEDIIEESS